MNTNCTNGLMAVALLILIMGCAPPPNAPSRAGGLESAAGQPAPAVTITQLPAGLAIAPILVPDTFAGSDLDVPSVQEVKRLLELPMPTVTDANRQTPVEQVIEQLSGRRLMWVPPDPQPAGRGNDAVTYESERFNVRGKTLGQYLRGLIGGGTSLGYPKLRMAKTSPATVASAPFGVPSVVRQQPELMDVIVVTRTHIVVVA